MTTTPGFKRLDFRLHNFMRLSWVNDHGRAVWEPRIRRIVARWQEIECCSVTAGIRPCALATVAAEQTPTFTERLATDGLTVSSLDQLVAPRSGYTSFSVEPQAGEPHYDRLVIGAREDVQSFKMDWERNDQKEIGRFLGYPPCCRAFFETVWVRERFIDTTWPMSINSKSKDLPAKGVREVRGPPQSNILLRWLGVRAVPHLPCSFNCAATVELAEQFIALGEELGYGLEMGWLLNMLDWPVEWSALHGIAEIKTPLFKVTAVTDATPCIYLVRRIGKVYPDEGATGIAFPYTRPTRQRITDSKAFQRGIKNPIRLHTHQSTPARYYLDNGFASKRDMDMAHQPIVTLATRALPSKGGRVLDLGCGNGALLQKLQRLNQHIQPYGVEIEADKVDYARELLPEHENQFFTSDMFACEAVWQTIDRYDLVLLMPGRLLEVSLAQAEELKAHLRAQAAHLLVYVYQDYELTQGNLSHIASKVDIDLINPDLRSGVSLARI